MLSRVQRGLEALYRIAPTPAVDNFLIDAEARAGYGVARSPREQLLLSETDGELSIGLFVDERAVASLNENDPTARLHNGNIQDFLLVVEGVSHFVYVTWRAAANRQVSGLELELQAEVDKYVTCLLGCRSFDLGGELRHRLFEQFEYSEDLGDGERERYRVANDQARKYTASLESRFVSKSRIGDMLRELRAFYRKSLRGKLEMIRAA